MESIVFNSNRDLQVRDKLKLHKSLTDFFGIYKLNKYERKTGRIIFQKDDDKAIKKRLLYSLENKIWTLGNEAEGTIPKIFWYYPSDDR